jgi:hypothetical protein
LIAPREIGTFYQLRRGYKFELIPRTLPSDEELTLIRERRLLEGILQGLDASGELDYGKYLGFAESLLRLPEAKTQLAKLMAYFVRSRERANAQPPAETKPVPGKPAASEARNVEQKEAKGKAQASPTPPPAPAPAPAGKRDQPAPAPAPAGKRDQPAPAPAPAGKRDQPAPAPAPAPAGRKDQPATEPRQPRTPGKPTGERKSAEVKTAHGGGRQRSSQGRPAPAERAQARETEQPSPDGEQEDAAPQKRPPLPEPARGSQPVLENEEGPVGKGAGRKRPMVRVRIDLDPALLQSNEQVVNLVADLSGIELSDLGKTERFEDHALVEVREDFADDIISAINGQRFGQFRLVAKR